MNIDVTLQISCLLKHQELKQNAKLPCTIDSLSLNSSVKCYSTVHKVLHFLKQILLTLIALGNENICPSLPKKYSLTVLPL